MTPYNRLSWVWTRRSIIVTIFSVSLSLLFAVYFSHINDAFLVVSFITYSIILVQARINLWNILERFSYAPTLILVLRTIVFFIPLPWLGITGLSLFNWGVLAGSFYGLILLSWQAKDIQFYLSKDFIAILPPLSQQTRFKNFWQPLLSALAQEYFYRGLLLYGLEAYLKWWSIIAVSALFAFEHFVHFNSQEVFDKKDFLLQFTLGLGLGMVFYFSHSLIGCILGHAIYNAPAAIQTLYRSSENSSQEVV